MRLLDFITEKYGLPEEDKIGLGKQLAQNKEQAERFELYSKRPPYMLPYMKEIERWNKRYDDSGSVEYCFS